MLEDSSITGEDILDEDAVLSDEEKILGADENELLKSPTTTPTSILTKTANEESKAVPEDDILESPTTASKKIVLKRKSSTTTSAVATTESTASTAAAAAGTTKENTEPAAPKSLKMSERNPITIGDGKPEAEKAASTNRKLSELTLQERLELRAKKFGLSTISNATPATTTDNNKKSETIGAAPVVSDEKQVEILKKRAERFGCVTSTNLVKLDTEEKLLKRKERFGVGGGDSNSTSTGSTKTSDWDEKARKRLERFNNTASTANTVAVPAPASAAST